MAGARRRHVFVLSPSPVCVELFTEFILVKKDIFYRKSKKENRK